MQDINIRFSRALLSSVQARVEALFPESNRAGAWVHRNDRQHWEFHGPDEFYWYGQADNAYHARALGWEAWLRKQGVED